MPLFISACVLAPCLPIRPFPELSLSPVFRRKWPSAYAAIEDGQQDQEWLEGYFIQQVPTEGPLVFALDDTAWPHPSAKTLPTDNMSAVPRPLLMAQSLSVTPTPCWPGCLSLAGVGHHPFLSGG